MQIMHVLGHTSISVLKSINKVRLYYQCYSLADIVAGTGINIRRSVKQRIPPPSNSSCEWPRVQPNANDFMIWEETLDSILLYIPHGNLILGDWVFSTHVKPAYLYHQLTRIVYVLQNSQWYSYIQRDDRSSRHDQIFNYANIRDPPTTNCQRGTYYQTNLRTIHLRARLVHNSRQYSHHSR